MMIAPIFALLSSKGILAAVYSGRAIASTGLLIILMLRVEYINRRDKLKQKDIELESTKEETYSIS
jgi:hypothetical protein